MNKYIVIIFLFTTLSFTQGCERENVFSWANPGDTSITARLADADKAMRDRNYEEALKIYDEILEGDPQNSEALYGKAAAELKNAGLDLKYILKTLIDMMGGEEKDPDPLEEILKGLSLEKLADGTAAAEETLKEIADGQADGTIPADDTDVNINLAFVMVANAYAQLLLDNEVESISELDDKATIEGEDKARVKIDEARDYAAVALGADHEIIKMFDDMIKEMEEGNL